MKRANSMFVAIAVGQGDAFFFQRRNWTALIDGGRSCVGFAEQFRRATRRNALDILVCTHNDADHALGVLGLLESGLTCKEVWLPGSWTDRLEDLLLNQSEFFRQLIEKIGDPDVSGEMPPPYLETLGERFAEAKGRKQGDDEREAPLDALWEAFERAEAKPGMFWCYSSPWAPIELWFAPLLWEKVGGNQKSFNLLFQAIAAASRIKDISLAAYHSGAQIR